MGGLQRRGLPIRDAFCVQAAIAPSSSLLLGGKKAGEGEVCFKGSTLLINDLRIMFPIGIWEENQSNLLFGRKALHVCLVYSGKMEPWVCEDGRELSHISVWCLETTERGCVSVP